MPTRRPQRNPLNLVSTAGVEAWLCEGENFEVVYGLIGHDPDGLPIYRIIFEKQGTQYLLVDPDGSEPKSAFCTLVGDDAIVEHLFEIAPDATLTLHLNTSNFVGGRLPREECFFPPKPKR